MLQSPKFRWIWRWQKEVVLTKHPRRALFKLLKAAAFHSICRSFGLTWQPSSPKQPPLLTIRSPFYLLAAHSSAGVPSGRTRVAGSEGQGEESRQLE